MTERTAPSGSRPTHRDPRYRRWRVQIFAITWIAYAAYYFTRQALSVAKVGILDDPSANTVLTKQVLGDLDALYLAAYAVGQFVWGSMADRFGPRVVLLGGLVMSAAAATFMGVLPALALFIPLMLVQGLAQSTGWPTLCKNVSAFFSVAERGRVLGLWSTNYAFGGLVAAPAVGWLSYSLFDNWRVAFFGGAAVVVIVLVLCVAFQRDRPEHVGLPRVQEYRGEASSAEPSAEPAASVKQTLLTAVRNKMVLTLGISYFLLKPARYAILLWGPVLVIERIPAAGKLESVVIPVAFGIAGVLAPIVIGIVSDRFFAARRVPPCVLSLAVLFVVLALFVPLTASGSTVTMVVMLALIGFAIYAADAMISCVAAVDFGTSERAGSSAGFVNGCGSVGAVFGGLLPGYLGATTLFFGFAGAALLACLILLPHWRFYPSRS